MDNITSFLTPTDQTRLVADYRVATTLKSWSDNFDGCWGNDLENLIRLTAALTTFTFDVDGVEYTSRFSYIPENDEPPYINLHGEIVDPNGATRGHFTIRLSLYLHGSDPLALARILDTDIPQLRTEIAFIEAFSGAIKRPELDVTLYEG